jgi:hypothetical protein
MSDQPTHLSDKASPTPDHSKNGGDAGFDAEFASQSGDIKSMLNSSSGETPPDPKTVLQMQSVFGNRATLQLLRKHESKSTIQRTEKSEAYPFSGLRMVQRDFNETFAESPASHKLKPPPLPHDLQSNEATQSNSSNALIIQREPWIEKDGVYIFNKMKDGVTWFAEGTGEDAIMWFHIPDASLVILGDPAKYKKLEGQKKTWREWQAIETPPAAAEPEGPESPADEGPPLGSAPADVTPAPADPAAPGPVVDPVAGPVVDPAAPGPVVGSDGDEPSFSMSGASLGLLKGAGVGLLSAAFGPFKSFAEILYAKKKGKGWSQAAFDDSWRTDYGKTWANHLNKGLKLSGTLASLAGWVTLVTTLLTLIPVLAPVTGPIVPIAGLLGAIFAGIVALGRPILIAVNAFRLKNTKDIVERAKIKKQMWADGADATASLIGALVGGFMPMANGGAFTAAPDMAAQAGKSTGQAVGEAVINQEMNSLADEISGFMEGGGDVVDKAEKRKKAQSSSPAPSTPAPAASGPASSGPIMPPEAQKVLDDIDATAKQVKPQVNIESAESAQSKAAVDANANKLANIESQAGDVVGDAQNAASKAVTMTAAVNSADSTVRNPQESDAMKTSEEAVDSQENVLKEAENAAARNPETVTQGEVEAARARAQSMPALSTVPAESTPAPDPVQTSRAPVQRTLSGTFKKIYSKLVSIFGGVKRVFKKVQKKITKFVMKTTGLDKMFLKIQNEAQEEMSKQSADQAVINEKTTAVNTTGDHVGEIEDALNQLK